MDLKDKLNAHLKKQKSEANNENEIVLNQKKNEFDIDKVINGREIKNEYGKFFLIKKVYPYEYKHGDFYFKDIFSVNLKKISTFIEGCNISNLDSVVFLDTETTGLSTGAGTIAFLIGIGYFKNKEFIIKQYFIRDYDEETAALDDMNFFIAEKKAVVSFNGKVFDWNLLSTRFIFNRISLKNKNPVHVDLLFPSRVLWKKKLESCRLSSLEENILKIERHDDIPGMLIPSLYFKYLDTKNAADMKKVILHNEIDILSMVSLFIKIVTIVDKPICETFDWYEIFGVSSMKAKCGEINEAIELYKHCAMSKNKTIKLEALKNMSVIFRRNKEYEKSANCLKEILKYSDETNILVMIDIAKYYEHRLKDYEGAIEIVNEAINKVLKFNVIKNLYYDKLKYRLDRLERKKKKV